jgi:hypothetical protein
MKRNIAIALFGLASLFAASGAFAQDGIGRITIPFAFSVSNTTMAPGHYRIASNSDASVVIRNLDQGTAVFSTIVAPEQASYGSCQLLFHRYGERYFLSQILCPSKSLSVDLPVTRREQRARRLLARGPVGNSVLLAMR